MLAASMALAGAPIAYLGWARRRSDRTHHPQSPPAAAAEHTDAEPDDIDSAAGHEQRPRFDIDTVAKWLQLVGGPGLIAALIVYFGWVRDRAYFGYLGVDPDLMQFSPQDSLKRSADSTFGTAVRALAIILVLAVVERGLRRLSDPAQRGRVTAAMARFALGPGSIILLGVGFLLALGVGYPTVSPTLSALVFAVGAVAVLRNGGQVIGGPALPDATSREAVMVRLTAVTALVLACFWAATIYAQDLGERRAKQIAATPTLWLPLATIYSDTYLDLPGSMLTATAVPTPTDGEDGHGATTGPTRRYRYTGLRVLGHSSGRWFLITGFYQGMDHPSVLILPDDPKLRIEVTPPTGE
jgi:hypothetical protein